MRRVLILGILAALLAPAGIPQSKRPDYCQSCERDKRGKIKRSKAVLREFQRLHPCPSTGKKTGSCPGWAKDHTVPLACKGEDAISNLKWMRVEDKRKKDAVERKGCTV